MNVVFALAGIVIKELYRRKDFYVLLIMTVVVTLLMASANLFDDNKIVGYLKEICLLLIWISTIVIAESSRQQSTTWPSPVRSRWRSAASAPMVACSAV